jgi:hypothetical protein
MNPQVTNAPENQPAVDFLTGSAVGPFVDTGVKATDQFGRIIGHIYLSKATVLALADLFETDRPDQSQEYARGFLDGTREAIGGNLAAVASDLRRYLDVVAPVSDGVVVSPRSEESGDVSA